MHGAKHVNLGLGRPLDVLERACSMAVEIDELRASAPACRRISISSFDSKNDLALPSEFHFEKCTILLTSRSSRRT